MAVSYTHLDVYKRQIQAVDIKFLRRVKGCFLRDEIRNEDIRPSWEYER